MKKKLLLILAILFTATSLFAMKLYLTNTSSAGQAQADPNASLGGYRSTTELSATSMKNLFDDVSIVEALTGDVEYRMVDIYNDGADPVYKAQFYMQSQTSSPGTVLSFGYSATDQPHADNWNGEALSNESTAPASPSMTFYDFTKTAPLALGTIPAGQSKRVAVKRTVTAGAPWTAHDLGRFGLKWGGVVAAPSCTGANDSGLETTSSTSTSETQLSSTAYKGQSFQNSNTFTFTGVVVNIKKAVGTSDDLVLHLTADDGGHPNMSTDLATKSFAHTVCTTSSTDVELLIDTPVEDLSSATTYWVYFSTIDTDAYTISRDTNTNSGYSSGTYSSYTVATDTWANAAYDLRMVINGCE